MDNQEAKFILNAYRPGGEDASDPRFTEALEQARRDPLLERWFSKSGAFDAAMTEKLRAIEVPLDLRDNILTGAKVSRLPRWPFIKWAIAAALISLVIVGSVIWRETRPAQLAGWQNQALDVVSSLLRNQATFDAESHDPAELMSWLHSHHVPVAQTLPQNLAKLASVGCKTFSWNGTPVSVICFMRPDGGLVHLVATAATPASNRSAKAQPKFVQRGHWATVTWREGDKVYMVATEASPDQLRNYLL